MTFPRIYKKEETDRWQREVEVCTWFHCSSAARGRPENFADQIFIILVIPIDHHCYDCSFLTRKVKAFANLERVVCCWCCYSVKVCWHDTHSSLWIGSMGSLPTSWQSWEWYFQSASSLNQKAESRRKHNNNLSDKNTQNVIMIIRVSPHARRRTRERRCVLFQPADEKLIIPISRKTNTVMILILILILIW